VRPLTTFLKNNFRLMLGFILLPVLIFISIYSLDQKGFFQIDQIHIDTTTSSTQKNYIIPQVESLRARLEVFKGASLWRFPLSQVSTILQSEDWIKEYRLSRSWPSSLSIEIEPQAVAYLIQTNDSGSSTTFTPVTQEGKLLKKIDSKQAPNTVIVHDNVFVQNAKIREGALKVLGSMPAQGRLHPALISEIGYDKKEGYWIRLIQSEMKINFGEEQFEIKSARVTQVLDYLENHDLKARVIDANLSKKVLVRMH
jgi:cell division protein FtsQ